MPLLSTPPKKGIFALVAPPTNRARILSHFSEFISSIKQEAAANK